MKATLTNFRLFLMFACLLAVIRVSPVPTVLGQTEAPLVGTVTTPDGMPVADVLVYGSESKKCCPFKREQTKTDDSGHFTLKNPGAVVHFSAAKFRPKAWVVRADTSESRFVLEPETKPFFMQNCKNALSGMRRIPGGTYGPQFDVPKKGFVIGGGKPDVDYVHFVIRPKGSSSSYLELWFGPYAFSRNPEDERYLDSVSFSERTVSAEEGLGWGIDVSGELRTGERWRHTYIGPGNGARYTALSGEAVAFDQIINSVCHFTMREK